MTQSSERPSISVVVASIVGAPFVDNCLRSLEKQSRELKAEVIVVACGTREHADRIARSFPWVAVLHVAERETIPQLRRRGVLAAGGEVVAVIEEHCIAVEDWLKQALAGLASGPYVAAGGPVADNSYKRMRDWVVYFVEYNGSLPPAASGETWQLNGANIAYRRQVLVENEQLLGLGYWEASLHPHLFAKGAKFVSLPAMVVRHCGPFNYGYYLQQRYWFSRAFAGHRARTLSATQKIAYLGAAPVVPLLLLARMWSRVREKQCRVSEFVQSLPLVVPALFVLVAGEWVGYAAGPGDALSKVE